MVYQGGKFRQSKQIAPYINDCIKENQIKNYYEPFCGGLNVLDKIKCENLFANDNDEDLIAFYQFIANGGEPLDDVSKEQYNEIRAGDNKVLKGNVKYMASFGARAWGGYAYKTGTMESNYSGTVKNFKKQIPIIRKTIFTCDDYRNLNFKSNSFLYLDPPYANTMKYRHRKFDHEDFYRWAREVSKENFVIISEYNMPDDFTCFEKISYRKRLAWDSKKDVVSDNLYYCDGLFKDWFECKGGIN